MQSRSWIIRGVRSDEDWGQIFSLLVSVYVDEGFTDATSARHTFGRSSLEKQGDLLVASDQQGHILGVVLLLKEQSGLREVASPGEAEFRFLGVDRRARGQGIGRELILTCLERARGRGAQRMVLSTQPSMRSAHGLYESLGFTRQHGRDWQTPAGGSRLVYSIELNQTGLFK